MEQRVSKHNYYLDIAQTVAERSTCLRRKFGAIIVRNDAIISTGYNGAPRGRKNCDDHGLLYACPPEYTPGRAVRAVPIRPLGGKRDHQCRA